MKNFILLLAAVAFAASVQAQVGINNNAPDAKSILDLIATDKGLLITRMTTAFRDAISSSGATPESLLVYDTDLKGFYFFQGSNWYSLSGWVKAASSNNVSLAGSASVTGTMSAGNIGTTGTVSSGSISNSGTLTTNSLTSTGNISAGSVSTSGNISAGSMSISAINGNGLVPPGAIIMWSGTVAPTGWALCDGTSGRPDLRGRFIIGGGGSYSVGNSGGSESVTLSANQLPPHVHPINDNPASPQINTTGYTIGSIFNFGGSSTATTARNATTNSPVDIRPPYHALAYIIKL